MAMLNGDVGGIIPSLSHSFDLVDTVDKNGNPDFAYMESYIKNLLHEKYEIYKKHLST